MVFFQIFSLRFSFVQSFVFLSKKTAFNRRTTNYQAWKEQITVCELLENYDPAVRPLGQEPTLEKSWNGKREKRGRERERERERKRRRERERRGGGAGKGEGIGRVGQWEKEKAGSLAFEFVTLKSRPFRGSRGGHYFVVRQFN